MIESSAHSSEGLAAQAAIETPGDLAEWDRSEWVGKGQEPAGREPRVAAQRPRWTKWQWIGQGQGAAGNRRGLPATAMPEGESGLSGHRHNPGMGHWGGTRF